jgi:colanic acid biosynthesis glycosyl transferase WcaI
MRVQLWSYNYAPEVTGIAPVSEVWAKAMRALGHDVQVVAAWPHYPEPKWEHPRRPYREMRDGIPVTRLPLWVGRASAAQRIRQELSFAAAQTAAIPGLGRPDVMVAVSPSFPALLPAIANARLRRVPWVLWLHDILPDGAAATGLVDDGPVLRAARALERLAYREADRIVVLSQAFTRNLEGKGVPSEKIDLIYDPATRTPSANRANDANGANGANGSRGRNGRSRLTLLSMGNIGFSQGLTEIVRAFESKPDLNPNLRFVITGSGVAAARAAEEIRTDRVEMPGLVPSERLEHELHDANLALVSQKHGGEEFNIPSKLMNFMMYGLPIVASVDPSSEVAHIVRESGGGWVVDNADPAVFAHALREIADSRDEISQRAAAARQYAARNFNVNAFATRFDDVLRRVAPAAKS